MKGEIGYLQRRADRFESYQQTHLRLMNEFSTYVVANPAENLPVIENGDAETINKQPSVQVEGTAVETSSTQIAPLSTPIQPLIAPAVETLEASVPLIQQPGTPTDYNYDEKDGNLSDGEIRDPQPPPAPLAPPAAKPLITPSKAVYERQTPIVEQEYYRPRYSFSSSESVNAKIARENAARRNRVANPCPDMRKPSAAINSKIFSCFKFVCLYIILLLIWENIGGCPFGDSCKFSHDVVPFSYCFRYNDTGHCGVQGCRFLHKLFEYVPPGAEPVQPPTRGLCNLILMAH